MVGWRDFPNKWNRHTCKMAGIYSKIMKNFPIGRALSPLCRGEKYCLSMREKVNEQKKGY